MKKQGKIKAIPVKGITEGIQVCFTSGGKLIPVIVASAKSIHYKDNEINIDYAKQIMSELKTLVVECEEPLSQNYDIKKSLPLKYSQWQSAIDNGEVDSGKVVEFEIKAGYRNLGKSNGERFDEAKLVIAKIIPQKKRMYSEEQVKIIALKYANAQHNKIGDMSKFFDDWFNLEKSMMK